jgi:hypothetical protein
MHVTVPVGRFGKSCVLVRYYPLWDEIELMEATSESGTPFDLHSELDVGALDAVYEQVRHIVEECWSEEHNANMRYDAEEYV